MKKLILSVVAAVALATPALAADLKFKAPPAPPPPPNPWDVAFGAGIQSDYIFRGVSQSNHKPSVNAYFEPRYNVSPYLQLYAGTAASSISFPNRAAAEVDGFAGIREPGREQPFRPVQPGAHHPQGARHVRLERSRGDRGAEPPRHGDGW